MPPFAAWLMLGLIALPLSGGAQANEGADANEPGFIGALSTNSPPSTNQPTEPRVQVLPDIPPSLRATLDAVTTAELPAESVWAARQWMNTMEPRLARYVSDADLRKEMLGRIYHESRLAGLSPEIVLAVIQVESAFRADAVSSAGAVGLMQIMPFWIRELGRPADELKDPWLNLRYGSTILAHYLAVERGDLTRALARYNGSLGQTWYPERVMAAWRSHWWIAP
ncbi:lytic transglycosylase domain-containing protein [Halomonas sp. ANAO-440]|uniref:lytic transglycosylase domain-containing protein n=1 Tax=Halomonas sp. ANAO-440 TaxID=2861360 RepID=UPI0039772796